MDALASHVAGRITHSRAASLRGHYPASSLTAGPSDSLSPSVRFPRCPRLCAPTLLRRFLNGTRRVFSSCSARPCHHAVDNHPAGVSTRISLVAMGHVAFAITVAGSASRAKSFEATSRSLALRPGDSPFILSMTSSVGFRITVSLLILLPKLTGLRLLPRWD